MSKKEKTYKNYRHSQVLLEKIILDEEMLEQGGEKKKANKETIQAGYCNSDCKVKKDASYRCQTVREGEGFTPFPDSVSEGSHV